MPEMTFAEAINLAVQEVMDKEPRTILIGSIGSQAVRQKYPDRVKSPPIAELGFCGIAIGAAMTGLRPIVSVGTGTFIYEAIPQVLNEAAVARYGSSGQVTAPVVFHVRTGIRGAGALQHSASPQPMFWNTPGVPIVAPATPADARGLMLTAALRSQDPVLFVDHERLSRQRGQVPEQPEEIPFGVARVAREGKDVTIVATSVMVPRCLDAAEKLQQEGISAEVLDLRTLVPLDKAAIIASVAKTGRVVIADETQRSCGVTAELAAIVADEGFAYLKAPVKRVAIPDVHISFAKPQEDHVTPTAERVVEAVRAICK